MPGFELEGGLLTATRLMKSPVVSEGGQALFADGVGWQSVVFQQRALTEGGQPGWQCRNGACARLYPMPAPDWGGQQGERFFPECSAGKREPQTVGTPFPDRLAKMRGFQRGFAEGLDPNLYAFFEEGNTGG